MYHLQTNTYPFINFQFIISIQLTGLLVTYQKRIGTPKGNSRLLLPNVKFLTRGKPLEQLTSYIVLFTAKGGYMVQAIIYNISYIAQEKKNL